jgi:hypothetical protein
VAIVAAPLKNVKLPEMWSWRAKPSPIAISGALNSTFFRGR